jgi:dipeptidyl aminopeptidase/acylaminoacyl peptidase
MYEKWSPSNFVDRFQTPTLVVHGEKDYRVPVTQAMQLFTALQLRKVPSRFLYFPDEGHWILKPNNSVHWYQSVTDWLKEWTGRPSAPPAQAPSYRRPTPPPGPVIIGPLIAPSER